MIDVRRATPADGPAYLALVTALADFEHLPPPDAEAGARLLADAFADPPRYELWVATLDGAVVAYAATFATYSTFRGKPSLYLEDLFVHPDARRRGVARAVLARLRAEAVARGCGRFEWMVLDWNEDAQTLYRAVGARPLPQWQLWRVDLP
ncbi:MAG: GNAT family N-acetyltransferase [Kofleriaceae bacterium]|nr:GNAT family N-acetyltransferase [Kofleriaceae bacterium]MCL4224836.1 GNAT family N-acetyltransferase [Myxococcales bacterium]